MDGERFDIATGEWEQLYVPVLQIKNVDDDHREREQLENAAAPEATEATEEPEAAQATEEPEEPAQIFPAYPIEGTEAGDQLTLFAA